MRKNLYFTDEQDEQVVKLMEALEGQGVDLRDNRGNLSISALIRYLIEKELRSINTAESPTN